MNPYSRWFTPAAFSLENTSLQTGVCRDVFCARISLDFLRCGYRIMSNMEAILNTVVISVIGIIIIHLKGGDLARVRF